MSGDDRSRPYASSPCMAHEIAPEHFDPGPPIVADPTQARDVARWRRAERARLRAARQALTVTERRRIGTALAAHLGAFLDARYARRADGAAGRVLSAYWPIKGEPDLRPLMARLHRDGWTIALPVVETRAAPLVFRRWTPETRMERGDWTIPVPAAGADRLAPDVMLAPVMGWDPACYRLGYGGGYFDRTLAVARPRPLAIGIGTAAARLATIYPQPHDIALDLIVTEGGVVAGGAGQGGSPAGRSAFGLGPGPAPARPFRD